MSRLRRLVVETVAIAMVGDGVVTLLQPRRHAGLWRTGPQPWRESMRFLEHRPVLTAMLGGIEAAAGLWLASRQTRERARS
jgi:hypothetical protein